MWFKRNRKIIIKESSYMILYKSDARNKNSFDLSKEYINNYINRTLILMKTFNGGIKIGDKIIISINDYRYGYKIIYEFESIVIDYYDSFYMIVKHNKSRVRVKKNK